MRMQTLVVAAVSLSIALSAGPAQGQAGGVQAKVPFRFSVAGKSFAAGEYTMIVGAHQLSVVSAADGRTVAMALVNKVSGHRAGATGRIIFRCYRERCFLAEVWSPAEENGRQVVTSRAEVESAKEGEGVYFAVLATNPRD